MATPTKENHENYSLISSLKPAKNCGTAIDGVTGVITNKKSSDNCVVLPTVQNIYLNKAPIKNKNVGDIINSKRNSASRRSYINRPAYVKLHRSLSLDDNNQNFSKLKTNYENGDNILHEKGKNEIESNIGDESNNKLKLNLGAIESLKYKYSPAGFGYPKNLSPIIKDNPQNVSKIPIPKPRRHIKSAQPKEIKKHYNRDGVKSKPKDENSNLLSEAIANEDQFEDRQIIIRQSESEESIDRIAKELSIFTMDKKVKEKKRSNSFRKIFNGSFFGRDKKKKEEERNKIKYQENDVRTDNLQNESNFNRNSVHRHTVGGNVPSKDVIHYSNINQSSLSERDINDTKSRELEKQYAEMHINRFNQIRNSFATQNQRNSEEYVPMDNKTSRKKPSISDYISVPVKKYIDTSSSTSTSELDRTNIYENTLESQRDVRINQNNNSSNCTERKNRFDNFKENFRETPPRAQETYHDFKLIKPKASIPINSERPLPNPYQNVNEQKTSPRTIERNLNKTNDNKNYSAKQDVISHEQYLDETYGTVFDSLEYTTLKNGGIKPVNNTKCAPVSPVPKSPSLESSKLKLPPNREIYNLQPRGKSPIPSTKISTEKIIATELLRNSRSPSPQKKINKIPVDVSHQNLEIEIDYSELSKKSQEISPIIKSKPPISPKSPDIQRKPDKITTNAQIHVSSPTHRPQTPDEVEIRNHSQRPQHIRSSTPAELRLSTSLKLSPQKDDIRKSVEAYYWKELKKLKEQEDYELYMMQLSSNGYLEDPVRVRRSRSLSPSVQRVGRRSLSLPRDAKTAQPHNQLQFVENAYGRKMPLAQPIPEGKAMSYMTNNPVRRNLSYGQVQYPLNFIRNTPERQTIGGSVKNYEDNDNLQRPIFKRGSLSKQEVADLQAIGNKKVSFSSTRNPQNLQSWPTKNGYTQSPPQRRPDRKDSNFDDDDVFLPNTPKMPLNVIDNEIYGNQVRQQNSEPVYAIKNLERYDPYYGQNLQQTNVLYYQTRPRIQNQFPHVMNQLDSRKLSYESLNIPRQENMYINRNQLQESQVDPPRRDIIITDNIYGQFGGYQQNRSNSQLSLIRNDNARYLQNNYNNLYSSKQSVTDSIYGQKQVSVNNKVCDIYGQIHDSPPNIQKTGVLYGQLQSTPNSARVNRQMYQANQNFVRGSRLTASANDMGRRYLNGGQHFLQQENLQNNFPAPTRPLPPIPNRKKVPVRYALVSDTESGSDASEIQRILNKNAKSKKRGFFGK